MADQTVGAKLVLDDQQARQALKNVKNDLKSAQGELVLMQQKFGETSKEALNAAKRVAELKDQIQDASELSKLFTEGNKFAVLGNTIRGLVGGFAALQGTLALAGVEGEDLQKTLLKVQGALALTEGLNVISEVGKNFKSLGAVISQTLGRNGMIGLGIAGVAGLVFVIKELIEPVDYLNNSLDKYADGVAQATIEVEEMNLAFAQAKNGIISKEAALQKYNQGIGNTIGHAKDLNQAEKLMAENAPNYIRVQGLKMQANYLLAESARLSAKALREEMDVSGAKGIGAFMEERTGIFSNKIAADRAAAAELLKLVGQINTEIVNASASFKTVVTPSGGRSSKPGDEYRSTRDGIVEANNALLDHITTQVRAGVAKAEINTAAMASDNAYTLNYLKNKAEETRAQQEAIAIEEYTSNRKIQLAGAVGQALGGLSDLVGKQTATGKVLAIAEATINTYLAASNILKNTARNPITGAIPGFAIAQMIATIAGGLVTVRNIIKTPVPGYGGSGGSASASVDAPLQARIPESQRTRLDADQINQIGNATVRAFVVESDIQNNRERITRLNRAARL